MDRQKKKKEYKSAAQEPGDKIREAGAHLMTELGRDTSGSTWGSHGPSSCKMEFRERVGDKRERTSLQTMRERLNVILVLIFTRKVSVDTEACFKWKAGLSNMSFQTNTSVTKPASQIMKPFNNILKHSKGLLL